MQGSVINYISIDFGVNSSCFPVGAYTQKHTEKSHTSNITLTTPALCIMSLAIEQKNVHFTRQCVICQSNNLTCKLLKK